MAKRLVFEAATRGGKYQVKAWLTKDGTYRYETFTSGKSDGTGSGYSLKMLRDRMRQFVKDAARYDKINYVVSVDHINVADAGLEVGPGKPGQTFEIGDMVVETTLHPLIFK